MSLEFKARRFYAVIGFVHGEKAGRDWLGAAWKDAEGPWHVTYRFRYYRDDKVWDSLDEKNWYEATAEGKSKEEVVDLLRKMADMLVAGGFAPELSWLTPDSDDVVYLQHVLQSQKWASVKHEEKPS